LHPSSAVLNWGALPMVHAENGDSGCGLARKSISNQGITPGPEGARLFPSARAGSEAAKPRDHHRRCRRGASLYRACVLRADPEAIRRARKRGCGSNGEPLIPVPDLGTNQNISTRIGSTPHNRRVHVAAVSVQGPIRQPLGRACSRDRCGGCDGPTPRSSTGKKRRGHGRFSAIIPNGSNGGKSVWQFVDRRRRDGPGPDTNENSSPRTSKPTVAKNPEHYPRKGGHRRRAMRISSSGIQKSAKERIFNREPPFHSWITTSFEGFEVKAQPRLNYPSVAGEVIWAWGAEFRSPTRTADAFVPRPASPSANLALSKWKE